MALTLISNNPHLERTKPKRMLHAVSAKDTTPAHVTDELEFGVHARLYLPLSDTLITSRKQLREMFQERMYNISKRDFEHVFRGFQPDIIYMTPVSVDMPMRSGDCRYFVRLWTTEPQVFRNIHELAYMRTAMMERFATFQNDFEMNGWTCECKFWEAEALPLNTPAWFVKELRSRDKLYWRPVARNVDPLCID